jgi:hypothetical protein
MIIYLLYIKFSFILTFEAEKAVKKPVPNRVEFLNSLKVARTATFFELHL